MTFFYSLVILVSLGTFSSFAQTNDINITMIKSDHSNSCLTVFKANNVNLSQCSRSLNQNFAPNLGELVSNKLCLTNNNLKFYLSTCTNSPNQIFLLTGSKILNPLTNECLDSRSSVLKLSACSDSADNLNFTVIQYSNNRQVAFKPFNCLSYNNVNLRLSCNTLLQWYEWNTNSANHYQLLSNYTDGNSYEEWCADFVSYIYMQSGIPFKYGERNNWDEYNANYIQNQNLTFHQASSGYIPKSGDIAFFDYPGGHVEMVAIGGKKPTFIYGDSATIDSQTGNGDMATNSKLSDGNIGNVTYYLSIN